MRFCRLANERTLWTWRMHFGSCVANLLSGWAVISEQTSVSLSQFRSFRCVERREKNVIWGTGFRTVFLNRRAAARYRTLASIIPGRERFSWNLSFLVLWAIFMSKCFIVEIFWGEKYWWICRNTQTQMLAWGNCNMLQDFISPVIDN